MRNAFLYVEISSNIATLIRNDVLKAGDRLPSVRMLCQEHGISMNTAKRVYLELEGQSLIESKPQSGYFVSRARRQQLPLPETSRPSQISRIKEPDELISKVYGNMGKKDLTLFSIGVPSDKLLPLAALNKSWTSWQNITFHSLRTISMEIFILGVKGPNVVNHLTRTEQYYGAAPFRKPWPQDIAWAGWRPASIRNRS